VFLCILSDEQISVSSGRKHLRHIRLHCPDQRDYPADRSPTQKKVEQEDGQQVSLAPCSGNDRGKKVEDDSGTKDRKEKEVSEEMHRAMPPPSDEKYVGDPILVPFEYRYAG
jgi:hypothetical protein